MNTYSPVEIDPRDRGLLEKIGRLRVLAWSTVLPDAAAKTDCWLDDFELVARHWCIFHDGEPVAAARMSVHARADNLPEGELYEGVPLHELPTPIASINRLVTHPEFRGRGFSDLLDEVRFIAAEQMRCGCCLTNVAEVSGSNRLTQLLQKGFRVVGQAAHEPRIHGGQLVCQVVVRRLPRSGS
jgi:hypothetical protein